MNNDLLPNAASADLIGLGRRNMMRGAGMGAVALAGAAIASGPASAAGVTDADILNFALNLEYLEAEFYIRAATGSGLSAADTSGPGFANNVKGGSKVTFTSNAVQQYAMEIAGDELNHVRFLRSVLGSQAVGQPAIDFTDAFATLGSLVGAPGFNPFADQTSFLIGSYVFEDVGVTAYHGAAPLVQNKQVLSAAAGILAVEAYHASEIRLLLAQAGQGAITDKISAVRASLSGAADDQGVLYPNATTLNIVPTDSNSLAFARTTRQVLNIVYGAVNATSGLFFPAGMNGAIR